MREKFPTLETEAVTRPTTTSIATSTAVTAAPALALVVWHIRAADIGGAGSIAEILMYILHAVG